MEKWQRPLHRLIYMRPALPSSPATAFITFKKEVCLFRPTGWLCWT